MLLILSTFYALQALSQDSTAYGRANTSIGGGALIYLGDLTPSQFGDMRTAKLGVQISHKIPVTRQLALRGSMLIGSLSGDDKLYDGWREKRSFSFNSSLTEVAVAVQWELLGNSWDLLDNKTDKKRPTIYYKRFSPYIYTGIGCINNNVTKNMTGIDSVYFAGDVAWVNYHKEQTTSYKTAMLVVPIGVGMHVFLTPGIRLYVEYCYHKLFNDHLDGFGVAVASVKPDAFQSLTLGLDFRFLK